MTITHAKEVGATLATLEIIKKDLDMALSQNNTVDTMSYVEMALKDVEMGITHIEGIVKEATC